MNLKQKYPAVCWVCLTILMTAGLKYVPPYLLEQRKLDQLDRVLDLKEQAFLQPASPPRVSVPAAVNYPTRAQLL